MRKLLNTLYITTPNAYLSKDGQNLVASVNNEERFRIPIVNIEEVIYFGYMGASPGAIKLCCENGVSLSYFTPNGRFIAHVVPPIHGNVLLREKQHELSNHTTFPLELSRILIAGKIYNYRAILRRFIRDNGDCDVISDACIYLDNCKRRVFYVASLEELRGIEGEAANRYFGIFDNLILNQKSDFNFSGRNRRPPKDPVNALLSFAYSLLTNDMTAALESVGLDPYIGFMHTLRPGRCSLSLDMIEELRAYIGDRFVLSLINRRQIVLTDFVNQVEDGVVLTEIGRKTFLQAWQSRKKDVITHPYLNEKIPIGLLPYVQAQLLARYLRGDLDNYPVFLIK